MIGLVMLLQSQAAAPPSQSPPPAARQIEWAVQAAPERLRADATVLGYAADGSLTILRRGPGALICLADDPKQPNHHVSCYHRDLDPFMARGRELRAKGLKDPAIDSIRLAEVKGGRLEMPAGPAALYQFIAKPGSADPTTGVVSNGQSMYVLYLPFATAETTGLSLAPKPGMPWLMDPGLPWAHVMITP
jgi:hypothetical protein